MNFEKWLQTSCLELNIVNSKQLKTLQNLQEEYQKQGQTISLETILLNSGYLQPEQLKLLQFSYQKQFVAEKKARFLPATTNVQQNINKTAPTPLENKQGADKTTLISQEEIQKKIQDTLQEDNFKNFGRYSILKKLGQGSFGKVLLAFDSELKREVAIKIMSEGQAANEEQIARFRREAQAIAKLNHPNIARVYEIGQEQGFYYFTMDYIDGQSLKQILKEKKRISPRKAAQIISKLAQALHNAHKNNFIHRDIKPENIMLTNKDIPYLMDFGLAREVKTTARISASGVILGTPLYMSPEQARGQNKELDARSDIYSLGVTFYEILTGQSAFFGLDTYAILSNIVEKDPIPPRQIYPQIPLELERICLKALEKNKENRYQNIFSMGKDLERYLEGKNLEKKSTAVPQKNFLGFKMILVLFCIVVYLFFGYKKTPDTFVYKKITYKKTKFISLYKKLEQENKELKSKLNKAIKAIDLSHEKLKKAQEQREHHKKELDLAQKKLRALTTITKKQKEMFRGGPAHNGYYKTKDVLQKPVVKWKIKTNKGIFSSAIFVDKMVYFGSDDNSLYAVNTANGRLKWRFSAKEAIASTPAILNEVAYFGSSDGNFYAISTRNRKIKWLYQTNNKIVSSPLIAGETVYFGNMEGVLYALDTKDGHLQWQFSVGPIWSSPTMVNGIIYFGSYDQHLYALDVVNKKVKWRFKAKGEIASSPSVANGIIYFGSRDNYLYALNKNGKMQWQFKSKDEIVSSPAIANGIVYIGSWDGYLYALKKYGTIKQEEKYFLLL